MGLLQKLLGRRSEESDTTKPGNETAATSPNGSVSDASASPAGEEEAVTPPETSSVLSDAAPLPETSQVPKPATPPTQRSASIDPVEDDSQAPGHDSDSAATAPEAASQVEIKSDVDPSASVSNDSSEETLSSSDTAEDADAATPADESPSDSPQDEDTDEGDSETTTDASAPETATSEPEAAPSNASASTPSKGTDYFMPRRPRREPLDIEPPEPPEGSETAGRDSYSLDVSGSPRAALRAAGVTVPHMQQVVQLDDVCLWAFGVRADEALGWWLQARQVHEQTGWMPVLLGAADDWLDNGEGVIHEGDDELGRMKELDAQTLLADKAAEAGEPARGVPILPTRGDSDFAVPKTDGMLGLVKAEHSWQIPALLPWKGSTNWELYGAEHASILQRWHEQHEVEIVSMTWDILELYVPSPPTKDEDLLAVAQEVYAYCPDLLAAGVPTLDDLAVHMVRSRAWYFRWT